MERNILSEISVEPAVFLYSFIVYIYGAGLQSLIQQKVCSPSSVPPMDFVCNDTRLLSEATDIVTTRSMLRETLPALACLLAGVWRDATFLNKPILYFSLIGEVTGTTIQLFSFFNWSVSSWIFSISDAVINGLAGGGKLFFVAATFVITDNSNDDDRTSRLTFILAAMSSGATLATALSGYWLTFLGYKWFFITLICLYLVTIALVMVFVKENKRKEVKESKNLQTIQKFSTLFKSRPNNAVIWLMIVGGCSMTVSSLAEGNIFLYYLEQGFGYSVEEAGVYTSYRQMISVLSSMIMPPIFTKILKWSDFKVGIVCALLTGFEDIVLIFTRTRLELVIFGTLEFFKVFLFTVPKSVITKCVDCNEIGVFVSLISIGECVFPIGMFYLYDYVFSLTSKVFPGAFYVASLCFVVMMLIFFSISSYIYRPPENKEKEGNSDLEKK